VLTKAKDRAAVFRAFEQMYPVLLQCRRVEGAAAS
jgi:hypothetical protein